MRFVQPMAGLLNITFRDFAVRMSGINNAFAYLLYNAITGVYRDCAIDYTSARVSGGNLRNVLGPAVTSWAGSILTFSWTHNSGVKEWRIAHPGSRQLISTGGRSGLTADLNVLPLSGLVVKTWIGFISESGIEHC